MDDFMPNPINGEDGVKYPKRGAKAEDAHNCGGTSGSQALQAVRQARREAAAAKAETREFLERLKKAGLNSRVRASDPKLEESLFMPTKAYWED